MARGRGRGRGRGGGRGRGRGRPDAEADGSDESGEEFEERQKMGESIMQEDRSQEDCMIARNKTLPWHNSCDHMLVQRARAPPLGCCPRVTATAMRMEMKSRRQSRKEGR